jgi:predicted SAM-dependent methyltransferase
MTTPSFYDKGEESWTKLNLGCGSVYLKGYKNVDVQGELSDSLLMSEIANNLTTSDDYYKNRMYSTSPRRRMIVDEIADFSHLPYMPNSIHKILCVQALEHIHPANLERTLTHWWNLLKANGILILSVPDTHATLQLIRDDPEKAIRFLQGSLADEYASHLSWFSPETLKRMVSQAGFIVEDLPNPHPYPAIVIRAVKDDPYCAGRGYQQLANYEDNPKWTVLDIGPGKIPFKGATRWLDKEKRDLGIPGDIFDLNSGRMPYRDKQFSYVYCSHVLEHLDDPLAAAKEIQRIGNRGYIECPTVMMDHFFQHGATHPKWQVTRAGNTFVFAARRRADLRAFKNPSLGSIAWALTQAQEAHRTAKEISVYRHFWHNQEILNIGYCWGRRNPIHILVVDANGNARW